jgi:hypothetical protein
VVADALEKAAVARVYGAAYVANLVRRQPAPRYPQPPLKLCDPPWNELVTDPVSLLADDAFILESGKDCDDLPRTETAATQSNSDEPALGADTGGSRHGRKPPLGT